MCSLMERLFQLYATDAVLYSGDTQTPVRVFFQGVNSRSWQNMEQLYGALGQIPRGQYIGILPAGTACAGDVLQLGGKNYRICRVENMALQAETVYQWALCSEKGGEDTWALES